MCAFDEKYSVFCIMDVPKLPECCSSGNLYIVFASVPGLTVTAPDTALSGPLR